MHHLSFENRDRWIYRYEFLLSLNPIAMKVRIDNINKRFTFWHGYTRYWGKATWNETCSIQQRLNRTEVTLPAIVSETKGHLDLFR
jgi:hypothetical protein